MSIVPRAAAPPTSSSPAIVERLLRYILEEGTEIAPFAPSEIAPIAACSSEMDMDGALHAAARRRAHAIPNDALTERLRRAHTENVAHNLTLMEAASEVLGALAERGVSARPLKGLMLLRAGVVENIGARSCVDVDMLTRPSDRATVTCVLQELGFRTSGVGGAPKHLPPFRRGVVTFEIHETAFWSRRKRYGLDALEACKDPLSFTLAHLVHHMYVSSAVDPPLAAKTIVDIVMLLHHSRAMVGQGELFHEARTLSEEMGLREELETLLDLGQALLSGTQVTEDAPSILSLCTAPTSDEQARRVLAYYRQLFVRSPWTMRGELLRSMLAPNRATMEAAYDLPPGSWRAYPSYLLRPVLLAGSVGRMALRAVGAARTRSRARRRPGS